MTRHFVILITSNYPDYFDKSRRYGENMYLYDIAAEDFVHAIASLPPKLPDDAIVKLERTYII